MSLTKYQNLWTLYKWHKNIKKIKNPNIFFNHYSFLTPKKKNSKTRNLIASILKQLRTLYPYQVKDYSEAEKLYKEYFSLENHIPSFESLKVGDYVKRFRNSYPAKGERFSEYHLNFSSGELQVLRVEESDLKYKWFRLEDAKDGYWEDSIEEGEITAFLFATKEEIKDFKFREKEYKKLEKEIQLKQKEVSKLREIQHKL